MASRGLRSVLQPVLFIGIASLLHALLFLIPGGSPGRRDPETSRGIRVKAYVEGPPAAARSPISRPEPVATTVPPDATPSTAGRSAPGQAGSPGGESGSNGGPYGDPGPSQGPTVGSGGPGPVSEYGQYLEHLRSDGVQGWARQSAKASRQGWKGSGGGSGGWGTGTGTGTGSGAGSGKGRGGGSGGTSGTGYLDPRVRMVIIQYSSGEGGRTEIGAGKNIEGRFRPVPYPDLKVKQARFTSGWWNVYIEAFTNKEGRIERYNVLRPETNGPMERVFVDQVKRDMERWTFDPGPSEIHVDVRFYVE